MKTYESENERDSYEHKKWDRCFVENTNYHYVYEWSYWLVDEFYHECRLTSKEYVNMYNTQLSKETLDKMEEVIKDSK
jgi:hypothetical protein